MATFSAVLGLLNPKGQANGRSHHRSHEGESSQMRKTKRSPDSFSQHLDASQPRQKRPALTDITKSHHESTAHNLVPIVKQEAAKASISQDAAKPNLSHRKLDHSSKSSLVVDGPHVNGKERERSHMIAVVEAVGKTTIAPQQNASFSNPFHNVLATSHSAVIPSEHFVDIDIHYVSSEKHCTEYARMIYDYLRVRENIYQPNANYMVEIQREIKEGMREILVDWLVEVAEEYQLSLETLFLTKNYIDRYLSRVSLNRAKLQLLGISSLLVASKFEDLDPTTVDELVYISDNTYDRNQVIAFESELLDVLRFELAAVTEKNFLRRYLMAAAAEIQCEVTLERTVHLSHYLIERTMQDFRFVRYKPSVIACSAICVALHTFGKVPWTSTLQNYTKISIYDESFRSCTTDLLRLFQHARCPQGQRQLQAVNEKYKSLFHNSNLNPPQHLPFFLMK